MIMRAIRFFFIFKALSFCLVLLHVYTHGQVSQFKVKPTGSVRGRVLDFDPMHRKFILEGEGTRHVVTVDKEGNYEIKLPIGIYNVVMQVRADGNEDISHDSIFKRASFRVNPNATVVINLSSLRDRVYCTPFGMVLQVIINNGAEDVEYPRPKYDTLWLPSSIDTPRDVVIEYCEKKEIRNSIQYKNATLTHNGLTISADHLRLNKKTYLLNARGSEVIIEDGSRMVTRRRAEVDLKTNRIFYRRHNKRLRTRGE